MRTLFPEKELSSNSATHKQLVTLSKLGYRDLRPLTITAASELIGRLMAERESMITSAKLAAERINLIELARMRVELCKEASYEWSGPCPKCGGTDRFHVQERKFMCRRCHPEWGDGIEWLRWTNSTSFLAACRDLTEGTIATGSNNVHKPIPKPATTAAFMWDEPKRRREALEAHDNLLKCTNKQSEIALAYLESRDIEVGTVKAFSIGYAVIGLPGTWDKANRSRCYPVQVAISLPWFNKDGALQCVKYRFTENHTYTDVNDKERTENKTSRGSSAGKIFGWQALQGPDKRLVLIIIEGEMNALSLWQVGNQWVDVLSVGSESVIDKMPTIVAELAIQYMHCIVWADKGDIANSAALAIGASSMRSPDGMDANDLLKAGKLKPLLVGMLKRLGIDTKPKYRGSFTIDLPDRKTLDEAADELDQEPFCDLTQYVGQTVSLSTWAALESECYLRFDDELVFDIDVANDDIYIKRLCSKYAEKCQDTTIIQRPPLPESMWVTGISSYVEASRVHKKATQMYLARLGMGVDGYYVAAPSSGLCAIHLPYPEETGPNDGELKTSMPLLPSGAAG